MTRQDGDDSVFTSAKIVGLRVVGSDRVLAVPDRGDCLVGSSSECAIRLSADHVADRHARIVYGGSQYSVHDLGSATGTWIDGVREQSRVLIPGAEIQVGTVRVIAESEATITVRRLIRCLVGFGAKHRNVVERLMHGVVDFALGRCALVVCGQGDLSSIAEGLHRTLIGSERPFIVVHREQQLDVALRRDATICMTARCLATRLDRVLAARSRIVICASTLKAASVSLQLGRIAALEVTPLEERGAELGRIVEERALDVASELGQASTGLDRRDRAWLRARAYRSFAELEDTVRRVVAIRTVGVTKGAELLGLTHGALSRWARRRSLP